jgi:hypothetical protein
VREETALVRALRSIDAILDDPRAVARCLVAQALEQIDA